MIALLLLFARAAAAQDACAAVLEPPLVDAATSLASAQEAMDRGAVDEGALAFRALALTSSDRDVAGAAADRWLDALNEMASDPARGDACWAAMSAAVDSLIALQCRDAERCARLRVLRCQIGARRADGRAEERRDAEASADYEALAASCERPDEMLANAAITAERARDPWRAAALWERLASEHPESALAPRAVGALGAIHDATADYEPAAAAFERLALLWPREEDTHARLERALVLRVALGDLAAMRRDRDLLERLYGHSQHSAASRAVLAAARALERAGLTREAAREVQRWLRSYSRRAPIEETIEASVAQARLDPRQASAARRYAITLWARGGEDAIARTYADPDEREMASIRARDAVAEAMFGEIPEDDIAAIDAALAGIDAVGVPRWSIAARERQSSARRAAAEAGDPRAPELLAEAMERDRECLAFAVRVRWPSEEALRCMARVEAGPSELRPGLVPAEETFTPPPLPEPPD